MYVLIVPIHIQPEHRQAFLDSMLDDAIGSVRDEPGCLRFDVIQDGSEPQLHLPLRGLSGRGGLPGAHGGATLRPLARNGAGLVWPSRRKWHAAPASSRRMTLGCPKTTCRQLTGGGLLLILLAPVLEVLDRG